MLSFNDKLMNEVLSSRKNNYHDNYDEVQCGKLLPKKNNFLTRFLDVYLPINSNLTSKRHLSSLLNPKAFYQSIIDSFGDMSQFYNLLNDDASKDLLIKLLAYKTLGYKKVKLPRNTTKYWNDIQKMRNLDTGSNAINVRFRNFTLLFLDLSSIGYSLKLNATPEGTACNYAQHQYEYHGSNFICKPEKGDVVIDGGACWGDTTLYFSHEVGKTGKVYAFEFIPDNMDVLIKNLSHNPHISDNIQIIQHPLWNVSDEQLYYYDHGPGSSVGNKIVDQPGSQVCQTISIDDFIARYAVEKVDFIKMDIEGAELNALKGAEKTIKKYQPKLAISIYHKPDDFLSIPSYLNSLGMDYDFYIDHHTIHLGETVLFAVPRKK